MDGNTSNSRPGDHTLFRLLEDCLRDERRLDPRFCPVCFLAVPYLLQVNSPDIPDLQTKHHSLWDACMRNLAVPLCADEVARLKSGMQSNIDNCSRRSGHEALLKRCGKDHITNPLELFRILLCLCLMNCLYGVDTSTGSTRGVLDRAHNPRKRFRSANGAWPTNVDQLFPFGPACTIRPLVMSTFFLADHSPLLVLNAILQLARPRVWDIMLEGDHHASLVWAIRSMILYGIGGSVSMREQYEDILHEVSPPVRDADWLLDGSALHISAEFLYTIVTGPFALPDDILRFLAPVAAAVREVFNEALDLCRTPGPLQADWILIVMSLFPASEKAALAKDLVSDDVVLRTVEKEPRTRMVLGVIHSALSSYSRRCAGPGCTRTILDYDEANQARLPTCGTCRIMRYCGKGCQRSDWQHGLIPHKLLCPVLATMQAVADVNLEPRAQYARLMQESCIPDDKLALAGRWALSTGRCYMDDVRCDIAFPDLFV